MLIVGIDICEDDGEEVLAESAPWSFAAKIEVSGLSFGDRLGELSFGNLGELVGFGGEVFEVVGSVGRAQVLEMFDGGGGLFVERFVEELGLLLAVGILNHLDAQPHVFEFIFDRLIGTWKLL